MIEIFWKPFENENTLERDREAKFDQILKEILLELEDKGRKITLKDEQRKAVKQLYGKKDLVAVLPTGFGKSLAFQLLVLLENRNRKGHTASVLVICPLTSIINDQILEVESVGLCACYLSKKLADLTEVESGKYHKQKSIQIINVAPRQHVKMHWLGKFSLPR